MDIIFSAGDSVLLINNKLQSLFKQKNKLLHQLSVVTITQDTPSSEEFSIIDVLSFDETSQLSNKIFESFEKSKRVFVHLDVTLSALFIMFSKIEDEDLSGVLDLVLETDGNA